MTDEARTVVAALHRLSDDVAEPPTVLTDAYHRAGQLRRRHRGILAGVLVLALTAAGAGWFAGTRHGPRVRTAGITGADLLTQPTRGDLAGDAGLRARALAAWRVSERNVPRMGATDQSPNQALYQLDGAPSVLLSQQTPVGPVAIVVQRAVPMIITPSPTIHGEKVDLSGEDQPIVSIGFLTTGSGGTLGVVDSTMSELRRAVPGLSFLAGAERSWLVTLSEGAPLGLSTHRIYHANGQVTREWSPIRLNAGVGVVAVPAGTDRDALVVAAMPVTRFQDDVRLNNPPPYTGPRVVPPSGSRQLLWNDPASEWDAALWVLPDDGSAAAAWGVAASTLRLSGNGWTSPPGRVADAWQKATEDATSSVPTGEAVLQPAWYAYGALPDGRGFVMADAQIGNDPSYLYGALWDRGKRTDIYGGRVDPTAVLPVRYRFADGQGWLVAAKGATFQYLTDTWHDAGSNAALLPAAATQVRVTPAGRASTVVPLA